MSAETEPASYKSTDVVLLREIVTSAEARLQAQLTASLAADQRALVLAGFLLAVIVALGGAAAALLLKDPKQLFLGYTAFGCAVGLLVALSLTVYAARPVDWSYPATRPGAWIKDIAAKKAEKIRLAEMAADAHLKIDDNATLMRSNGKCVNVALWIAIGTLVIGAILAACFFACQS